MAGDGSGRHEQPLARNKRLKQDDDDEDAPTYVLDETNQSVTKAEYEAMISGKDTEDHAPTGTEVDREETKDPVTKAQSRDNIADSLTKGLNREQVNKASKGIGLKSMMLINYHGGNPT